MDRRFGRIRVPCGPTRLDPGKGLGATPAVILPSLTPRAEFDMIISEALTESSFCGENPLPLPYKIPSG